MFRILDVGSGAEGTDFVTDADGSVYTLDLPGMGADFEIDLTTDAFQEWEPGPFDMIVCCHVLEHLPAVSQLPVWEKLASLLKPGALMHVLVPDMEALGRCFSEFPPVWALMAVWGSQNEEGMFHKFGFNEWMLQGYCAAVGLEVDSLDKGFNTIEIAYDDGGHDHYTSPQLHLIARKPDEDNS